MSKFFSSILEKIAKKYADDPAGMLISTGVIGWMLSSAAQICAILFNPKIPNEQKGYLVPQEFADAAVNIGSFFAITQMLKYGTKKLFDTGKFAPKKLRAFLAEHKDLVKDKIGRYDFNLENTFKDIEGFKDTGFDTARAFGTTLATITGGVISTNLVTPIVRNQMATKMQKNYINYKKAEAENQPTFKAYPINYSNGLKI